MNQRTFALTYFPVATQRQFAKNQERIRGKPYEKYFDGNVWLAEAVMPAIRAPMQPADALRVEDVNSLLEPGYQRVENGFCELADGTGYVASHVPLPGCTGEMYRWWFWWHAVESERCTLWYPHNHVSVRPRDPDGSCTTRSSSRTWPRFSAAFTGSSPPDTRAAVRPAGFPGTYLVMRSRTGVHAGPC